MIAPNDPLFGWALIAAGTAIFLVSTAVAVISWVRTKKAPTILPSAGSQLHLHNFADRNSAERKGYVVWWQPDIAFSIDCCDYASVGGPTFRELAPTFYFTNIGPGRARNIRITWRLDVDVQQWVRSTHLFGNTTRTFTNDDTLRLIADEAVCNLWIPTTHTVAVPYIDEDATIEQQLPISSAWKTYALAAAKQAREEAPLSSLAPHQEMHRELKPIIVGLEYDNAVGQRKKQEFEIRSIIHPYSEHFVGPNGEAIRLAPVSASTGIWAWVDNMRITEGGADA